MALLQETPHRWTVREFHRLCEEDFFGPEARVELIEGSIYHVTAQGPVHRLGVSKATEALIVAIRDTHRIYIQANVDFEEYSSPKPDLAVFRRDLPTDAELKQADLLIEVSFSRLTFDRTDKASLYAKAKVPEYWILNVRDMQLEMHRGPRRDRNGVFGYGWRDITIHTKSDTVSPLCRPDVKLLVADLM